MKVTLSAAMRARDVSRPRPEDEEAARRADGQAVAGNARGRAGRTENRPEDRTENRTENADRAGRTENYTESSGRRKRR
jgi:hypothetical protein